MELAEEDVQTSALPLSVDESFTALVFQIKSTQKKPENVPENPALPGRQEGTSASRAESVNTYRSGTRRAAV